MRISQRSVGQCQPRSQRGAACGEDAEGADAHQRAVPLAVEASGWLEMVWHLDQWGDAVEVISPPERRAMVEAHRRADFPALP